MLTRNGLICFAKQCLKLNKMHVRNMSGAGLVDIMAGGLKDDEVPRLSVRGYGEGCFQVNETHVQGSIFLLPHTYYIWEGVDKYEDITKDSLMLFPLIYPTIEVLFLGVGDHMNQRPDPALIRYFKQKGIIVEVSNTANAAATFNVLNGEGRNVAAALLALGPQESSRSDDGKGIGMIGESGQPKIGKKGKIT